VKKKQKAFVEDFHVIDKKVNNTNIPVVIKLKPKTAEETTRKIREIHVADKKCQVKELKKKVQSSQGF
jgi:hypothetical protein